jgi:hypothetical protein
MSTIKLRRSAVPGKKPSIEQLNLGEIAINTYDGKMFFKRFQEYLDDNNETVTEEIISEFTASVPVRHKLFIQLDGHDRNDGTKWDSAFKTFEKALEVATARNELTVIEVGPGVYYTQGHLDVPDNCIIKAIHRSVFVKPIPGYEERNVFRLGSGCFLEGIVFEGWRLDDMDDPSEGFAVAFRPGALITRVPYVHKVVVRTPPFWFGVAPPLDRNNANPLVGRGAGVVLADASVLDPDSIFPNIMTWGATPVTHNGIGYCAKNGGLINAVNAISLWCHRHFYALSGGQIILSSCATQFGDFTMVATGSRQIISPTEVSIALTEQVTASNALDLNRTTIIDNMWSELVTEGYTASWPADFEATTKRDAGMFLQSLSWTLRTANEKPMLDFARGFFNTNGGRTFDAAPYDFDKSLRDALLINDAVAYDLLFNSNFRSIKAARSFYRASATNLLTNFKDEVLLSLNRQKNTFGTYLSGTSLTRSNALFDEIIDVVTNGESAADAYLITDPTDYNSGFFEARRLLVANSTGLNEFIQDEIIAWINVQIAAKTPPFQDFEYNETLCRRDTGLVIDAIAYDMAFGSNYRSIIAGRSYLRSQASNVTSKQLTATVGALTYLKTLLLSIVTGNATATASVTANMDLIIDIVETGESAIPSYVLPAPTGFDSGFQKAVAQIEANRSFIKAELIQQIKNTFPSLVYDTDVCRRDIDYILDSVKYDLTYGGNLETLVAAKSYYDNVLLSFIIDSKEIAASVSAYTFLKTLISQVITSTVTTTLQNVVEYEAAGAGNEGSSAAATAATNLVDIIVDYLDTQVLANEVAPSLSWVDSGLVTQFNSIATQKNTTIDSVITYIDNNFVVFSYNETACRRDVTFILEALRYDLTYGGNLETYNAAISYFVGAEAQYGSGEKLQTVAALTRLKAILADILQGSLITKSSGNTKTQDTSGTSGSLAAALFAQARIDDVINTINNNGTPPTKLLPNTDWPATEFKTNFFSATSNTRPIARDVAKYTAVESGTLIGAFIYSWEFMRDAVKALPAVGPGADATADALVNALITTIIDPSQVAEPSTITAIGHTWTGIMSGVALTKIPPARNEATIEESILELNNGIVIASGQDDQGSALFIGGMKIDADTGELTGPPFEQSVNRIATRTAIARSF